MSESANTQDIPDAEIVDTPVPEEAEAPQVPESKYPSVVVSDQGVTIGNVTFPAEIVRDVNVEGGLGQNHVTLVFSAEDVLLKSQSNVTVNSAF